MSQGWKDDAHRLAASVARITSVAPSETWLTDRLVEFQFLPPNADAAPISLVISELEVTFGAGRGLRVELDGPAISAGEVESLAAAVVAGHLSEIVSKKQVSFTLRPVGLPAVEGKSSYLGGKLPEPYGVIEYAPYQATT
jgi:hypothetical protein